MSKTSDKAKELGGTISGGINWTWADFETEASATTFNTWCTQNGYETRGVYAPQCTKESSPNHTATWGVRYR